MQIMTIGSETCAFVRVLRGCRGVRLQPRQRNALRKYRVAKTVALENANDTITGKPRWRDRWWHHSDTGLRKSANYRRRDYLRIASSVCPACDSRFAV